uniref:Peroxisomal ATPase PEX6 n=2 Tax=Cacopsylla melanoneura TaxID=428564 RepID=A0A8D9EZX7_9HEMI
MDNEVKILQKKMDHLKTLLYIVNSYSSNKQCIILNKLLLLYVAFGVYIIKKTKAVLEAKDKIISVECNLQVEITPIKVFNRLVQLIQLECDRDKCILVGTDTLKQFNLKSGDWIIMTVKNQLGFTFKRTVQVLEGVNLKKFALISDLNMFNIVGTNPVDNEKESNITVLEEQCSTSDTKDENYLRLMTSDFTITCITNLPAFKPKAYTCMYFHYIHGFHNNPNQDIVKQVLNNYFAVPRYLHLNDIVRIDLKKYNLDMFQYDEVNYLCNIKYVYFKLWDFDSFEDSFDGINTDSFERTDIETESKQETDQHSKEQSKEDNVQTKTQINPNKLTLIYKDLLKMIIALIKQDHHGGYITSSDTAMVVCKPIKSFIPNIVRRNALDLQNAEFLTYDKYILKSHTDCQYFNKLMKCLQVFFYGGGQKVLKFHNNPIFLVTGSQNSGREELLYSVAERCGVHTKQVDCVSLIGNVPTIVEKNLENLFDKAKQCAPCLLVFHNIEDLCTDHSGNDDIRAMTCFTQHITHLTISFSRVVVVCTSSKAAKIHHLIKRLFLKTIDIVPLTEPERRQLIQYELDLLGGDYRFDPSLVDYLSSSTAGFEAHDLTCLVRLSVKNKILNDGFERTELKEVKEEDFQKIYADLQSRYSERLDAPSVPNVLWEDIGGLSKIKGEILSTFRAVKRTSGLKRSGLLLHGPPGTGKTLIAKAVATECRMNFLAVKGPELLNKYIGQSEENIRNVFLKARAASPCVVFFDELDSLAPRRGQEDQSSGVMDRVVSQLLAEMDGVHASKDVFILGATNRLDLLDPAILRPGRLDKSLCVGLYEDRISQLGVLKAVVRKFHLSPDVSLESLVHHFPSQMSGADIYAICSKAWTRAIRRIITTAPETETVTVNMEDFLGACPPTSGPEDTTDSTFSDNLDSSSTVVPEIQVS